jgi:hypothetical protein
MHKSRLLRILCHLHPQNLLLLRTHINKYHLPVLGNVIMDSGSPVTRDLRCRKVNRLAVSDSLFAVEFVCEVSFWLAFL